MRPPLSWITKPHCTAIALVLLAVSALAGCATPQRNPIPIESMREAEIPGMPGVRSFADEPRFTQDIIQSVREEPPGLFPRNADGTVAYSVLILSGGGQRGAFGAGFLNGWTQTGTRPTFKLVTGISAGALIAPFAFLGPDYDALLKKLWTTIDQKQIARTRLSREALVNSRPLAELIAQYVSWDVLEAVAAEHKRGRRLYIGTTHMGAQRLMIWNMGAIAATGHPGSLELFHNVMRASASIPVFFPPVMFEVEANGVRYDEMHTDGGTVTQLFFMGATMDLMGARRKLGIKAGGARLYIIRNGQSDPVPEQIERKLSEIAPRALNTVIKAQSHGDLVRIYAIARANKIDFNYVEVPSSYVKQEKGTFNKIEMNRLFDLGVKIGSSKNPWEKKPRFVELLHMMRGGTK